MTRPDKVVTLLRGAAAYWVTSKLYRTASTLWLIILCSGFNLFPGERVQRVIFYSFAPLAMPAVAANAKRVWRSPLARVLTVFLAYTTSSALWSAHWLSVGDAARKSLWIGFFLLICAIRTPAAWRRIMLCTMMFAAAVAAWSVTDFLSTCQDCSRFGGYGRFANSNYTANVAGMAGILGLGITLSAPGGPSAIFMAAQVPLLCLLTITGSRAALLSYLAGLGLSILSIVTRRKHVHVGRVMLMLAVCLAAGLGTMFELGIGWLATEIGRGDTYRIQIWTENIKRTAMYPIFGHGVTTLDEVFLDGERVGTHAHDMFLAQAFYGGMIGVALWVTVLGLAASIAWRRWRADGDTTLLIGLVFLFLVGLVDIGPLIVDVGAIWFYVWLPLGIILSCDLAERERVKCL